MLTSGASEIKSRIQGEREAKEMKRKMQVLENLECTLCLKKKLSLLVFVIAVAKSNEYG